MSVGATGPTGPAGVTGPVGPTGAPGRMGAVRVPRPFVYALVAIYVSMFAMTAVTLWYANQVAYATGHKFCAIIVRLDDSSRETPPTSDRARRYAEDMANLRRDLGCQPPGKG